MQTRTARNFSWHNYCGKIEAEKEANRLDKILASNPEAWIGALKLPDGGYTTNERESLTFLAEANFPECEMIDPSLEEVTFIAEVHGSGGHRPGAENWRLIDIVTPRKLNWAIDCPEPFKAPGPDTIFPTLLIKSKDILRKPLLGIFRRSIATGHILGKWKEATVVFIPKLHHN